MEKSLIDKYNVPGPRYTSYPTVPFWNPAGIELFEWKNSVKRAFEESNKEEGISIYIHLPYCESLCTFCGCHKRITKQHNVEEPYINAVLKEWQMYTALFDEKPIIKELHFGGGTPTFFSPDNLSHLVNGIFALGDLAEDAKLSFEGHPNNTTGEHLKQLYTLGFRRVSFGVQDYDPVVQKTINRIQPFEKVKEVTDLAREIGYESISHDLVFGLPKQTLEGIRNTIEATNKLMPDRIAFYSYAHVPWVKGVGQRGFDESDLPKSDVKRKLYEEGKATLESLGYVEIGMDHFALEHDEMYVSMKQHKLHRNFMGYTASKTKLMVGLGVSSISDSWYAFAQNVKTIDEYYKCIDADEWPVFKGHDLTAEDLVIRKHILNIMCRFQTSWKDDSLKFEGLDTTISKLKEIELDGLLDLGKEGLQVKEEGRPFIRNICMAFDLHLLRKKPDTQLFSLTI